MARITFKRGDEYLAKISKLGLVAANQICGPAIYRAADIVTDQIRVNLNKNLSDPSYVGKKPGILYKNKYNRTTGDLADSLGIAELQNKDGYIHVKVGFDGYDSQGVPNQLKARVMESGTSVIHKRPFVRPAVNSTRKHAVNAMKKIVDEEIEKIMKE